MQPSPRSFGRRLSPSAWAAALLVGIIVSLLVAWGPEPAGRGPPPTDDPRPATEVEGLEFDPPEIDLGVLAAGEGKRIEVPWKRSGAGDLRVLEIQTGCACVVSSGLSDLVPEGAHGTFVLDVHGRSRPGPFAVTVRVVTDRRPDEIRRVRITGFVGSKTAVDPPSIHLGASSPGRAVHRAITVRPPPSAADAEAEADLMGLEGACDVGKPAERGALGSDVRVRVEAPRRPGVFSGYVEVRVRGEGTWRVPVDGEVVAESLVSAEAVGGSR